MNYLFAVNKDILYFVE